MVSPQPNRSRTLRAVLAVTLLAQIAGGAADISRYTVLKGEHFTQTSYRGPSPDAINGHRLVVSVTPTIFNNLTAASVQPPTGPVQPLAPFAPDGEWGLEFSFDTAAALDAAFPDGYYGLNLTTVNDGSKNIPLSLKDGSYPNAPRISNFIAAQAVSTNNAFLLTWDPFVGGTTNDYIYVEIFEIQRNQIRLASPALGQPGALNGTATSFVVPSRTLVAGRDYPSHVIFMKGQRDTTTYPGGTGLSGNYRRTDFLIKGVNQNDLIPATLLDSTILSDGRYQFTVVGFPNRSYVLSHTTDFLVWTPFLTNTAPAAGMFDVVEPTLPGTTPRFYRAETRR